MTRVVKSNTPWLAALWLCCGTAAVVAQDDNKKEEKPSGDVQEIIRDAIKNAQQTGEAEVSIEVESVTTEGKSKDGKVTGKVVITDGTGKSKIIDLGDAFKNGGHRMMRLDGDVFEVLNIDKDDLDFNFDALRNNSAIRLRGIAEADAVPRFRIGVSCELVDEAIRAHVDVPEDALMVRDVVEDGPAAEAGMKRFDILVRIAEKPVGSLEALVEQIQASKGEEVPFVVLRKGQEVTVTIQPAKRKASEVQRMILKGLSEGFKSNGKHNLNIVVDAEGMEDVFQFEALQPGILLDKSANVEKLIKRLPMIIGDVERLGRSGKREVRFQRRSKRPVKTEESESHEHQHDGDKEEAAHEEEEDDDDDDNDDSDELRSRVTQLSKEIRRLEAALQKLQSKRR